MAFEPLGDERDLARGPVRHPGWKVGTGGHGVDRRLRTDHRWNERREGRGAGPLEPSGGSEVTATPGQHRLRHVASLAVHTLDRNGLEQRPADQDGERTHAL